MILIVIQVFLNKASKEPGLNEAEHSALYGVAVWRSRVRTRDWVKSNAKAEQPRPASLARGSVGSVS